MRLKSLTLNGFKSFANKTDFEFDPGVTGIVGPNGCGKSNVVDAIRWVLGETSAKALRGGEMADVIFNGTDKRKPVGMAEVTLTLAACEDTLGTDYHEVALTRRVFRDGKSEYRLNGTLCRLRDFNDLLMDTGIGRTAYSIMEQGKIDLLLSSKPEDRRTVFEEAAGITKFKSQKKEALRKLEYTEANLLRVTDIIEEVKRQINSLNRQANKARRYRELLADVRVLDTHFSHRKFVELDAERGELNTSIASLATEIADRQAGVADLETGVVESRNALASLEAEITNRREQLIEIQNRMGTAESRIEFNEERNTELEGLAAQNGEDVEKTRGTLDKERGEMDATAGALNRIAENLAHQRQQHAEHERVTLELRERRAKMQTEREEIGIKQTAAESELVELRAALKASLTQAEGDKDRAGQLVGELTSLEKEHAERRAELDRLDEEMGDARGELEDSEAKLALADKDHREARDDRERLGRGLEALHRELAEKESRLEVLKGLVDKGEGLDKGTNAVLGGINPSDPNRATVRGMLSSFMEVEQRYIPAIEAALGNHLQTILVSDSGAAEQAIAALTDQKLGRASVIPESFIPPAEGRQMMTLPAGVEAWALDKVRSTDSVRPLLEHLLDRTLIVGDLHTAIGLRAEFPGYDFATLDGAHLSARGVVYGGAGDGDEASSLLARLNEIRELEATASALTDALGERQLELEQVERAVLETAKCLDQSRELLQATKISQSTREGKQALLQRECDGLNAKLENARGEQGELRSRQQSAESKVNEQRDRERQLSAELEKLKERLSEVSAGLAEAQRQETDSAEMLNELRTAMAVEEQAQQALQDQKAPIAARMQELEAAIARRESEIASYRERIRTGAGENDSLRDQIETLTAESQRQGSELGGVTEQRSGHRRAVDEAELGLRTARTEVDLLSEQRGKEEVKLTQIDLRVESLCDTIRQRYSMDLELFEPDSHALLVAIADQKQAHSRREKRRSTMEAKEASEEREELPPDSEQDVDVDTPVEITSEEGPDWSFVELVIGELKQRLDSMGPVNLDAIEEFEALQERYDFLTREHDDLVSSKDHLHKVISKINRETRKRFEETFEQVRTNFRDVFKELFGEQGRADLLLLDEDDPLECGIEVIAKPPGKKPQSITLLSGGERSMTAVALLFSIYMVKPSPFCVLDELDAPLDDSNIGRFLRLLERFTEHSQFVIVTHNRRTMRRCEVMYGITQEEFGISKLIGMKLAPAEV